MQKNCKKNTLESFLILVFSISKYFEVFFFKIEKIIFGENLEQLCHMAF